MWLSISRQGIDLFCSMLNMFAGTHELLTLKKLLLAIGAGAFWDLPKAATSQMQTNPGAPLPSGTQAASFKALSLPGDRPKPPTFFNGSLC